jgi:hypothetical protein
MIENFEYFTISSLCRIIIKKSMRTSNILSLPISDEYILLDRSSVFYYPF